MRVLHVAWGFKPFRSGGLIEYAEDLMEIQLEKGYDVFYFCAGRYDIFVKGPKLKRWQHKRGYPVYELINPPILNGEELGTKTPDIETSEPLSEAFFTKLLAGLRPDVVHFHELQGLPTSLISICKSRGVRTIFTTHDFFLICPTTKLFLPDGRLCTLKGEELCQECANCSVQAHHQGFKIQAKLSFRTYFTSKQFNMIKKLLALLGRKNPVKVTPLQPVPPSSGYLQRREENIRNLEMADVILANSARTGELYRHYSSFENLRLLHITLRHIHRMRPLVLEAVNSTHPVITFGLSNVMSTSLKGRDLMQEVFDLLQENIADYPCRFEFVVLGRLDDPAFLKPYPFVRYAGPYKVDQLDKVLQANKIKVGIVPSMCEEPFGLVGIEFLGKGIPVIGNKMGGITDYVINHETGWVNERNNAEGLVSIIRHILAHPAQINQINLNLIGNRSKYIKSMDQHFHEIDAIYKEGQLRSKASPSL